MSCIATSTTAFVRSGLAFALTSTYMSSPGWADSSKLGKMSTFITDGGTFHIFCNVGANVDADTVNAFFVKICDAKINVDYDPQMCL